MKMAVAASENAPIHHYQGLKLSVASGNFAT